MTIENTNIIDIAGIDKKDNSIVLTIVDHLEWGEQDENHLLLLQEKINHYLSYADSGEIYKTYPDAKKHKIKIETVGSFHLNKIAEDFYQKAKELISKEGFELSFVIQSNT